MAATRRARPRRGRQARRDARDASPAPRARPPPGTRAPLQWSLARPPPGTASAARVARLALPPSRPRRTPREPPRRYFFWAALSSKLFTIKRAGSSSSSMMGADTGATAGELQSECPVDCDGPGEKVSKSARRWSKEPSLGRFEGDEGKSIVKFGAERAPLRLVWRCACTRLVRYNSPPARRGAAQKRPISSAICSTKPRAGARREI